MNYPEFIKKVMNEVWIKYDTAKIDSYYADDFVGQEEKIKFFKKDLQKYVGLYKEHYTNPSFRIEDSIVAASEGKVAIRFIYQATQRQSGEPIVSHGQAFFQIKDKKIASVWIAAEPALD